MKYFFQDAFGETLSIIVEDDGNTAYAYLLENGNVIADVWLYNHNTPEDVNWKDVLINPLPNPKRYVDAQLHEQLPKNGFNKKIKIEWLLQSNTVIAKIYRNDLLIAILTPGSKPGWSSLASNDGPLAKKMVGENQIVKLSAAYFPSEAAQ